MTKSEYNALCCEFLRGDYGNNLPQDLKEATQAIMRKFSPGEVARIQFDALKTVLLPNTASAQCLDRFGMLLELNHSHSEGLPKLLKDFAHQTDPIAGSRIPDIKDYFEETNFMITKMAEITEDLDIKISRLIPYEMQLFELQQISHAIVQNADFGVLAVDNLSKITMFNKAASNILHLPENVVGKTLEEAFFGLRKEDYDFVFKALHGKSSSLIEVKINGETKVLEVVANVLLGKAGEPEGAVVVLHDVTLKEREKKILEENIKLAAVGKLAAGVAHEIKNPLTVIKGFSQLLLAKDHDDPQVPNFLRIICEEADRANLFIQDFLSLGKPKQPSRKLINVRKLVADVIALLESQCFLQGIDIEQHLDCSCELLADPDQLKQVLINLAKNSVEAMEGSKRNKKLTFFMAINNATQTFSISIKDTGCGIPEEMMSKIMTSFFTTKKYGTGLGLNISKNIIEQHGGHLKFFSSPEGTTATIELPLMENSTEKHQVRYKATC